MGLDTTVYSGLQLARATDHFNEVDGQVWVYVNPNFVRNAGGLVTGLYTAEKRWPGASISYMGHSRMRDHLTQAIHGMDCTAFNHLTWTDPSVFERAFGWLIAMSDCEGVIGGDHCVSLARDFAEHAGVIRSYANALPMGEATSSIGLVPYSHGDAFLRWCEKWEVSLINAGDHGGVVFQ
jgi:hypothetical protein